MDPGNLAKLKLRRLIRYLWRIDRWRKEERQEPLSRCKIEDELWRVCSTKDKAWWM
jgi:hypothetical protein